jgi:hypothetical protein
LAHLFRCLENYGHAGAEGAMGKGEGSRSEAEEDDLSGGAQENCGGAAGTAGEVETRSIIKETERGGDVSRPGPRHFVSW